MRMIFYGICKFSLNNTNVFLNFLDEDSGFRLSFSKTMFTLKSIMGCAIGD